MGTEQTSDLQAALRQLESLQNDSPAGAQRRTKRYPVRGEAHLWTDDSGPGHRALSNSIHNAHVRDISRGGIGVLCSQPVAVGHLWQVQLVDSDVTVATIPAFCRFCRQITEGAYLAGMEFGMQASVLMAMGVSAKDLAKGDAEHDGRPLAGEFVDPGSLLDHEAA